MRRGLLFYPAFILLGWAFAQANDLEFIPYTDTDILSGFRHFILQRARMMTDFFVRHIANGRREGQTLIVWRLIAGLDGDIG